MYYTAPHPIVLSDSSRRQADHREGNDVNCDGGAVLSEATGERRRRPREPWKRLLANSHRKAAVWVGSGERSGNLGSAVMPEFNKIKCHIDVSSDRKQSEIVSSQVIRSRANKILSSLASRSNITSERHGMAGNKVRGTHENEDEGAYDVNPGKKSRHGSMMFPRSSLALFNCIVARMLAAVSHASAKAMCDPGHTLQENK